MVFHNFRKRIYPPWVVLVQRNFDENGQFDLAPSLVAVPGQRKFGENERHDYYHHLKYVLSKQKLFFFCLLKVFRHLRSGKLTAGYHNQRGVFFFNPRNVLLNSTRTGVLLKTVPNRLFTVKLVTSA